MLGIEFSVHFYISPGGGIGIRAKLKISYLNDVRVRVPPRAPKVKNVPRKITICYYLCMLSNPSDTLPDNSDLESLNDTVSGVYAQGIMSGESPFTPTFSPSPESVVKLGMTGPVVRVQSTTIVQQGEGMTSVYNTPERTSDTEKLDMVNEVNV